MGEINRALGAAGAAYPLVTDGRTYKLMPLTKGLQAELEAWLYGRAVAAVSRDLDDAAFAQTMASLADRRAEGRYDFTGRLMDRALRTVDGMTELLRLMLARHHPEMTADDVFALIRDYGRECVTAVNAITADIRGNVPAPVAREEAPA